MSKKNIHPLACPECGYDLRQLNSVIVFENLPDQSYGHFVPGKEGTILELDKGTSMPDLLASCTNCGSDITNSMSEGPIEDIQISINFEISEE